MRNLSHDPCKQLLFHIQNVAQTLHKDVNVKLICTDISVRNPTLRKPGKLPIMTSLSGCLRSEGGGLFRVNYSALLLFLIATPWQFVVAILYAVVCRQIDKRTHRSKDSLPELSEVLRNLKRSEFNDSYLSRYKVIKLCVALYTSIITGP